MSCPPEEIDSRLHLWTRFNITCPEKSTINERNAKRKALTLQHRQNAVYISKKQQYKNIVQGIYRNPPPIRAKCELRLSTLGSENSHPIKRTYRGGSNKYPYSGWSFGMAGHSVGSKGSSAASRAAAANELKNNPQLYSRLALPPSLNPATWTMSTLSTTIQFINPYGVAGSPDGSTIAVSDMGANCVYLITVATGAVRTITATFNKPSGVAYSPDGKTIAVTEGYHNAPYVRLITVATGAVATGAVTTITGTINNPSGVAYSPDGKTIAVVVAYYDVPSVHILTVATGAVTTITATFNIVYGVAYSPDSKTIAVADTHNHRIRLIDTATDAVTTLAGGDKWNKGYVDSTGSAARFDLPTGVAYSPDGSVIAVADKMNHCVRLINVATASVTTIAASINDALRSPHGVAFSPDGLSIAVSDQVHLSVHIIELNISI